MRIKWQGWAFSALIASTALVGCNDNKNAITQGRRAIQREDYAEAHRFFDEALQSDPRDYHALWSKADVYRRENKLEDEAKMLERIYTDEEHQKNFGPAVRPLLETNYRKQAEVAAAREGGGEQVEAFLRKALELNPRSDESNLSLVTLLAERASKEMRAKNYEVAIKDYEEALKLRMAKKQRATIKAQIDIAQFMKLKAEFTPRWEKVKEPLTKAGIYDEKTDTFFVEVEVEVEGKRGEEGFEEAAERMGLAYVAEGLNELSFTVAGKERPEGARVSYSTAVVSVISKGITREASRKEKALYKYRISVPFDAVLEKVSIIDQDKYEMPEAAPAEGAEGAAEGGEAAAE